MMFIPVATAHAQDETAAFVAEPVPGSQVAPAGGYFLLEAEPGEEVTQSIGLRNDSDAPLALSLDAVDAVTGQLGGASYDLADETPAATGTWIELDRASVRLDPRASAIVSFRVVVPDDAQSGQHLAGISISVPKTPDSSAEAGEGQAGASIDVQTRRIIALQVELPGPSEPKLVIGGVTPVARPDGLYLEIGLENAGYGLTKAEGVLSIGADFERNFQVDTFVPRTSIAYPVKWSEQAQDGDHTARVELRYGGEVASWEGSFSVGETVIGELEERQVVDQASDDGDGGSSVPLPLVAAGVVAGAALVGGGLAAANLRRPVGKHSARRHRGSRRSG